MKMMLLRLIFVCSLIIYVASTTRESKFSCGELFGQFVEKFDKSYADVDERALRLSIFAENIAHVRELNKMHVLNGGEEVFSILTPFADQSREEFRSKHVMERRCSDENVPQKEPVETVVGGPVPDAFDWIDHGAVSPVKNQGDCGSCWAFSAAENIEGQYAIQQQKRGVASSAVMEFSPMHIVECDPGSCGCYGGWPKQAYQWLIDEYDGKLAKESDYPYCVPGGDPGGNCYPCILNTTFCGNTTYCNTKCQVPPSVETPVKLQDWVAISKDEDKMKTELYQRGPLSVLLNAEYLQFYFGGLLDPWWCDPESLDHAVLLVGYGTMDHVWDHKDFWAVRNSWGAKWGEKGLFKLRRGKGKCGINQEVTSAVLAE